MDYKFFIYGIKNIILNPAKAWDTIYSENKPDKLLRNSYFFPLLILVSISAFIGSLLFANAELSPVYSVFAGIKCFIVFYFTTYITTLILGEITFPLDLGRDFSVSLKLIVYSLTPFLICQIFSGLFESLLFIDIFGLYGLYIFWTGAEKMLAPPSYKKLPMLIATTITLVGIYIATNIVLNMLIDRIYFAFFA
jgi:hypothetical protein